MKKISAPFVLLRTSKGLPGMLRESLWIKNSTVPVSLLLSNCTRYDPFPMSWGIAATLGDWGVVIQAWKASSPYPTVMLLL